MKFNWKTCLTVETSWLPIHETPGDIYHQTGDMINDSYARFLTFKQQSQESVIKKEAEILLSTRIVLHTKCQNITI